MQWDRPGNATFCLWNVTTIFLVCLFSSSSSMPAVSALIISSTRLSYAHTTLRRNNCQEQQLYTQLIDGSAREKEEEEDRWYAMYRTTKWASTIAICGHKRCQANKASMYVCWYRVVLVFIQLVLFVRTVYSNSLPTNKCAKKVGENISAPFCGNAILNKCIYLWLGCCSSLSLSIHWFLCLYSY